MFLCNIKWCRIINKSIHFSKKHLVSDGKYLKQNYLYIFRLFDSEFNLLQINESECSEKNDIQMFRCQGRYAKNL